MKQLALILLLSFIPAIAICNDSSHDLVVYSNSAKYYGKVMRVDFFFHEIKKTPICTCDDASFPVTQPEAIQAALEWAKINFDPKKSWKVQEINLKFLNLDTKHCVYVVQLQPGNEMQSLIVGVLMNGDIIPPVEGR